VSARREYSVACLAGDGTGPELMAEASRAIEEVAHMHGFRVEQMHVPFGGDAVRRVGHPLPAATRAACLAADAVLVAATREPALEGVKADLDLTWRIMRVRLTRTRADLAVVSALVPEASDLAAERAFALAASRRAHVTAVAADERWNAAVERASARWTGITVERSSAETALMALARTPGSFDVVACERESAEALSSMAAFATGGPRMVASGRLSGSGPGLFGPTHGSAPDIAGQGVANPSGMLLATALMLGEGLGERAAATTLEGAVVDTLRDGVHTADLVDRGAAKTTREFMDVLLAALPSTRTDAEFTGVGA